MTVLVAVDAPAGASLATALEADGVPVVAVVAATALADLADDRAGRGGGDGLEDPAATAEAVAQAHTVVLQTDRATLTAAVVALCDRRGIRIVPLAATEADARRAASFGLAAALPLDTDPWRIADALRETRIPAPDRDDGPPRRPRIVAVWGAAGAPGRSTLAIELSVELARGGRSVGLVDADTHAPSIALQLGLADEGPGFAAACRQAGLGTLDAAELTRIATPLGRTGVEVLTGLNRPSRWPELTHARVTSTLEACRTWADDTVVDVAGSLERDEEIVSDLDGLRRNAATLAVLQAADLVVAVAAADPLGIARFLRAHAELRATIGATPVLVVANRLRPGTLGIDARGQVRRTLDRFGGVGDVWFVPNDPRSTDAAILAARPVAEVAPKSALTLAVRRFVGESPLAPPRALSASGEQGRVRRPRRSARAAA